MLPVYFFQGGCTKVCIESYSTAKDVKKAIMKKLRLQKKKMVFYGLYQVIEKKKT